ncbi:MAG: hypothetical protein AUG51_11530 [Acidobacteria bacterium 13_1_20CM_3_53_8]|nr:MAG: hypothetical protein AUG51_11530 [Acidobacteria bacterium 13_1_20CM_3_53_8]
MSNGEQTRAAELEILFSDGQLRAQCKITGKGLYWQSQPVNMKVDLTGLDGKISQLKDVLTTEQTDLWANLEDPLAEPASGFVADQFADCVERVVSVGFGLYSELADLGLRTILDKIDSTLREDDQLSIQTDCAFLPWEILYPYYYDKGNMTPKQKKNNPLRPKSLWGYKYKTEYILYPLPDELNGWAAPIDEHEQGPDYISFNLNKEIDAAFQARPFKPVEFHRQFFNSSIGEKGKCLEDKDSIVDFLLDDKNGATIIYMFCHGDSGSPLTSKMNEVLDFGEQKFITPQTLEQQNTYLRGPIVILNSCLSATVSPLSFSSFHKKFRKKRAMGVIGTTIKMPATFAAAFGRKLIECYMNRISIGCAIYQLRRELLDRNNPLGLFYSLQCPGDILAPQGGNN